MDDMEFIVLVLGGLGALLAWLGETKETPQIEEQEPDPYIPM